MRRRSLIEKVADGFILQPLVMAYCTKRLINKLVAHISQNRVAILNRHALAQVHILQAIWESLVNKMGSKCTENHLKQLLYKFQTESPQKPGYLADNILNLLCKNNVYLTD